MKKIFTLLILSVTSLLNAQDFEGVLTYSVDFEVAPRMIEMGMTKDLLKEKMESEGAWFDKVEIYYQLGNYRQVMLAKEQAWTIYRNDENKIYSFQSGEASDICSVSDASTDLEFKMTGNMPVVSLLDTLVKYEDYQLKMVEVRWKSGTYYYLYDEAHFPVDPELYKGHVYDGFHAYLEISQAYPIIMIKKAGPMTITISLVDFEEKELEAALFEIPELEDDEDLNLLNFGAGKMMRIKVD